MPKIMRIYYDNAGYPYKDSALSVRYPIVEGNEFTGANNTTEVHFYTNNLSAGATWVANCKLPNSELVNRLLIPTVDEQGIVYQKLLLDRELTNFQGHLKIGLNGYAGNISIDEEELDENNIVVISGTPTIIATGIVDIAMNYNPVIIPLSDLTTTEYEQLLAIIGSKLDITKGIYVVEDIVSENYLNYALGQILYDKESKLFYRRTATGFILENIDIGSLTVNGETLSDLLAGIVYEDELDNYYTKTEVDDLVDEKVDKTNVANKVYGTDEYGNQATIDVDDPLVGEGPIVRRVGSGGQVIVGNPQADNHATPKSYVDTELGKKVDKLTTSGLNAYVHLGSTQTEMPIATPATGDTIAKRESDGRLKVATPTQGGDATTKAYVDDEIGKAVAGAYKPKGSVATYDDLPTTGNTVGDVYNVLDTGANYVWVEENGVGYWDKLGETINWEEYNETFLAAGFLQASEIDSVPEELTFDNEGNITNPNWTGIIDIDYMSPPISDISISAVPDILTFDTTQDYDNMITNADWTGIMTITY